MNELILAIYAATGVPSIPSAWVASIIVFSIFALIAYGSARAFIWAYLHQKSAPVVSVLVWLTVGLVLLGTALLSIGLVSFVGNNAGLRADSIFQWYFAILFLVSTGPFWWVLWRAGFLGEGSR